MVGLHQLRTAPFLVGAAVVAPDAVALAVKPFPHGNEVTVGAFGDLRMKRNFLNVWTQPER